MARIYISGLINTETTVQVRQFPIHYYPIDYPFFGVQTAVSGVAYNIAKAMKTLGDSVTLASVIGKDLPGNLIVEQLKADELDVSFVRRDLDQTAASVVLYAPDGRRQIYCDLKDIQDRRFPCEEREINGYDFVAACNINFNRDLLQEAKRLGKTIATDVHVLTDVEDAYNREFMESADILFLSDEGLPCGPEEFLFRLCERYGNEILVLGRGGEGAMMYVKAEDAFYDMPCVPADRIVNTVGAGDALFSAFLHFFAKGIRPEQALRYAQIFASAKICADGASKGFISEEEVLLRYSRSM